MLTKSPNRYRILVTSGLALLCFAAANLFAANVAFAQESLRVLPDRTTMAENETLQVTVRYENGNSDDDLNLDLLKNNFDILSNNRSSQYINNNGQVSRFNQWAITLAPKRAGKLLIPPLSVGGVQSQPITITVTDAQTLPKGSAAVFLETHIEKSEVYVQEEFVVTLKLFYKENLVDVNAEPFAVDKATIEELPRSQYQTTVIHARYDVIQLRFAVTPDASGQLEIPSYLWTIRTSPMANSRFGFGSGRSTLHRLRTDKILMNVKPRPDSYPANAPWLPARDITIAQSWSQNPPQFKVGEPITRTITVNARGLSGEQLPPLTDNLNSAQFKFYPDQPNIKSDADASGKFGSRSESVAIVPTSEGEHVLPAVKVVWWDVDTDELKVAELPEQRVVVSPGAASTSGPAERPAAVLPEIVTNPAPSVQPTAAADSNTVGSSSSPLWLWVAAVLFALNVGQLLLWFVFPRRSASQNADKNLGTEGQSLGQPDLKAAIQAAKNHDAIACKRALQQAARTLTKLDLSNDDSYQKALAELNATLYGAGDNRPWNGDKLAAILSNAKLSEEKNHSGMPSLYPLT